ncbi:PP2C family protein-serine/threonine phosphatase [Streptomyces sp. enrichment culture]|uniref:PP2C family protein-serine/threonine phosphatase n=1 Tax=Streptomyces sp. enrichment culture TaxID=1795815 RepID=UPI003F552310
MIRIRRPLRGARVLGPPTVWGAVAITYKLCCPLEQQHGLLARIATSAVFFAVGTGLILHVRQALLRELRQVRRIARAAQSALLRPLPPRIDGLNTAAAQLSADRGATVGGDLYEVVATEYGVRAVMGDVRGHGIAAIGTVAALLGSFREAAHDEPDLGRVLHRLERALARHLRERARAEHPSSGAPPDSPVAEEFVTLLLLEIHRDGELLALNCGHPWPYRLTAHAVIPLSRSDPLPPLGPFPLPPELPPLPCAPLLPGHSLVLYTDGAEDARDGHGRFFDLRAALADLLGNCPQAILHTLLRSLRHHTGGRTTDDIALLVLRNDRTGSPCTSPEARGAVREATTHRQPTNHR